MNDDQIVTLLRDTPLPADPPDRYAAVTSRGRRADKRRTTVLAAVVTVVAVTGTASALTWRGTAKAGPDSFLSTTEDAGTAHVAIRGSGLAAASGTGELDFVHAKVRLDLTVGGQHMQLIGVGHDTWLGGSEAAMAGLAAGKHWMHVKDDLRSDDVAAFNPAKVLGSLRDAHASFTARGHTEVAGIDTTDYLVTGKGQAIDDLFPGGSGHVFVDSTGLVRRIAYSQHESALQIDFSDFGAPVDIQPPPAADTAEQPDLSSLTGITPLTPGQAPQLSAAQRAQVCAQLKGAVMQDGRMNPQLKQLLAGLDCGK